MHGGAGRGLAVSLWGARAGLGLGGLLGLLTHGVTPWGGSHLLFLLLCSPKALQAGAGQTQGSLGAPQSEGDESGTGETQPLTPPTPAGAKAGDRDSVWGQQDHRGNVLGWGGFSRGRVGRGRG